MVNILDIGSGKGSVADVVFTDIEDKNVVRLDANPENEPDVLHDITQPLPEEMHGKYQIVYVSHVMEHIERDKVLNTFRNIAQALAPMGEIWVTVPSMEWAASEILAQRDGIHIQAHIFGGQGNEWDYHKVGFTLKALRQMMDVCGLLVRKAYQAPFVISFKNEEYNCVQNVVIGLRYQE